MLFWVFVLSKAVSRVVMDIFITLNLKGSAITPQIGGSLGATWSQFINVKDSENTVSSGLRHFHQYSPRTHK